MRLGDSVNMAMGSTDINGDLRGLASCLSSN